MPKFVTLWGCPLGMPKSGPRVATHASAGTSSSGSCKIYDTIRRCTHTRNPYMSPIHAHAHTRNPYMYPKHPHMCPKLPIHVTHTMYVGACMYGQGDMYGGYVCRGLAWAGRHVWGAWLTPATGFRHQNIIKTTSTPSTTNIEPVEVRMAATSYTHNKSRGSF